MPWKSVSYWYPALQSRQAGEITLVLPIKMNKNGVGLEELRGIGSMGDQKKGMVPLLPT